MTIVITLIKKTKNKLQNQIHCLENFIQIKSTEDEKQTQYKNQQLVEPLSLLDDFFPPSDSIFAPFSDHLPSLAMNSKI